VNDADRGLAAAAHFAKADEAAVAFDLHDRAHEPSPVTAVGVAQRRLERHGHGRRANVGDFHRIQFRLKAETTESQYGISFIDSTGERRHEMESCSFRL
jgi:hypothetical protein